MSYLALIEDLDPPKQLFEGPILHQLADYVVAPIVVQQVDDLYHMRMSEIGQDIQLLQHQIDQYLALLEPLLTDDLDSVEVLCVHELGLEHLASVAV